MCVTNKAGKQHTVQMRDLEFSPSVRGITGPVRYGNTMERGANLGETISN
jgi:hypothetical protein